MITEAEEEQSSLPTDSAEREAALRSLVTHISHLLPSQSPIEVFVHHNTLHAFVMVLSSARIRRCSWLISFAMIGVVIGASVATNSKFPLLLAETSDVEADEKEIEADDLIDLIELSLSAPLVLSPSLYGHFFDEPVENFRSFSIGHRQRGPPCC